MTDPTSRIVTTDELAARWRCSRTVVAERWRSGKMPPPFNADQARGWRWHLDVIEAYEHGNWAPAERAS